MDTKLETFLDENNAALIQGGVSISVSSCNADGSSEIARAVGCRVSKNRRSVTLLFPRSRAEGLLAAIESSGKIAAVFSDPPTHITLQLKGIDAEISAIQKVDSKINQRYVDAFAGIVCPLGFADNVVRALVSCTPEDLSAVTFTVCQAFRQTPGPRAGEPLSRC